VEKYDKKRDPEDIREEQPDAQPSETPQPEQPIAPTVDAEQPDNQKPADEPAERKLDTVQPAPKQPDAKKPVGWPGGAHSLVKRLDKRVLALLGGTLLLVLALIWSGVHQADGPQPPALPERTHVEAINADETGIAPDTMFRITLPEIVRTYELRERVEIVPPYEFTLVSLDSVFEHFIMLDTLMNKDSALSIFVDGEEFAFTVRNELVVTGQFPAEAAHGVPVDSMVTFTLNSPSSIHRQDLHEAIILREGVGGRRVQIDFRQQGRYIHIMPREPLRPQTRYIASLSPPLENADGARLLAARSFSFTTGGERPPELPRTTFELAGNRRSVNILAGETPVIQAHIQGYLTREAPNAAVTVRAFENSQGFFDVLHRPSDVYFDAAHLPIAAEFEVEPFQPPEDMSAWRSDLMRLLVFPEELPVGWYHVEVTVGSDEQRSGTATRQILLQVSEISVFYMATGSDMLVWVHDTVTGQPISGAQVIFGRDITAAGTTDNRGVAMISGAQFAEPEDDDDERETWRGRRLDTRFTVNAGERVFMADDSLRDHVIDQGSWGRADRRYISYVYTDRAIYRTTDTIRVWGVVRPRDFTMPIPTGLELRLSQSRITQPVTLLPDGTFTATIELEDLAPQSWERMELLTSGGYSLGWGTSLTIEDFVTPVFNATSGPDAPVFLLGDDNAVSAWVNVSMFDGTPVPALQMALSPSWNWGLEIITPHQELVTDAQGNLSVEMSIERDRDTWRPQTYHYRVSIDQAVDENLHHMHGRVSAIHRDVMLTARRLRESETIDIEVSTHRVDISGIEYAHQLWKDDALRGAALSQNVTAELHRVYHTRERVGNFFDFVNRQVRPRYRFTRHEELVETITLTTAGGSYIIRDLPRAERNEHFFLILRTYDSLGRRVEQRVHIGTMHMSFYERFQGGRSGYRFSLTRDLDEEFDGEDFQPTHDQDIGSWHFWNMTRRFGDGQDVTFSLMGNGEPVEETDGFILTAVAQEGFFGASVTQGTQVSLPFSESLLPNYTITGAFFDGRRIFELENTAMHFNPERRELEITLTPDAQRYSPGATMQVEVEVVNAFTGQPAADTVVLLSVVDEAIFALREQHISILRSLYRSVFHPHIHKYTSFTHFPYYSNGMGGGGDDEASGMRTDFQETPHFATATTDAYGRATITVQLPDNITSWRLTSLAISPDNHAGHTIANTVATLDYFVTPIVNQTLLAGDHFVVGLYSAGIGVAADDPVSYRVRLVGEGVNMVREAQSTVRGYASVDFGPIGLGEYTVTVEGFAGEHRDGIELPVEVIASGIEISRVETFRLSEGIDVDPLRFPVSITFYSEHSRVYNAVFRSVSGASWRGDRAEARLARRFVAEQRGWQRGERESLWDINGRRVFPMLPQATTDIELTVLAHLALPELVSGDFLDTDFADPRHEGRRTAVDIARALAGEEPQVSPAARIVLAETVGLDLVDKIYLAMAMAISGYTPEVAHQSAEQWYIRLVGSQLTRHTGLDGSVALSLTDPDRNVTRAEATAAALMLATLLEHDDAHGLALYLAERRPRFEEPFLLEQIFYLQTFEPLGADVGSLSFRRDGETITQTLTRRGVTLSFNRSEFAQANFEELTGVVYADVYFIGTPEQTADEAQRHIGFTKTLEPVDGVFEPGALVRVTLTPDLSAVTMRPSTGRQMIIDDYIPTGMRFERFANTGRGSWPNSWHPGSRQGQRLQLSARGNFPPIVYYVRCVTPGEYLVESAFISSAYSAVWGMSERGTVTIQ